MHAMHACGGLLLGSDNRVGPAGLPPGDLGGVSGSAHGTGGGQPCRGGQDRERASGGE